jgi:DNA topoisomerase-1
MSISTDKKLLVIVESPNKVSTITKIFKDLGYTKAVVMASVGHTTKIKDNRNSYHNTGIYPDEDFRVDWAVDPDKKSIVDGLKAQAKTADLVLIASDPDREGESLGNHIKRLLKLNDNQYYRIKYHSVTKEDIKRALEHPEYMNLALCEAAESRQVVDKMIGYTLSPVAKSYLGARSVGRCQSAGLKLIVDREKEIQDFIPEYYYDLFFNFTKEGIEYRAKYIGTSDCPIDKIKSTDQLLDIKAECGPEFKVTEIQKKQKKESAKPPFCTATFQQEAANKLGLKVKDAMSCAQKLFEGISINGEHTGLITYMRTDATDLAADFLPKLETYITDTYGEDLYHKPKTGRKQQNAQEGHEALRVVDPNLTPEQLSSYIKNELLVKVYRLIWQRTIASAMPDAIFDETSYIIASQNHLFKLTSSNLKSLGYKIAYGEHTIVKQPQILKKNEIISNGTLQEAAKSTQPPARYKEATLIKELQKQGIGRPSTYVTIVETVLSPTRSYCVLEDKEIVPTERGIQLANFLDRAFSEIINLDYTRNLEESLDAIATSKLSRTAFLSGFHQTLEQALQANKETVGDVMGLATTVCPKCGSPMIIRRSRFGKLFYGCSSYPTCNGIINIQ